MTHGELQRVATTSASVPNERHVWHSESVQITDAVKISPLFARMRKEMHDAADRLDFETAAILQDEIEVVEKGEKK